MPWAHSFRSVPSLSCQSCCSTHMKYLPGSGASELTGPAQRPVPVTQVLCFSMAGEGGESSVRAGHTLGLGKVTDPSTLLTLSPSRCSWCPYFANERTEAPGVVAERPGAQTGRLRPGPSPYTGARATAVVLVTAEQSPRPMGQGRRLVLMEPGPVVGAAFPWLLINGTNPGHLSHPMHPDLEPCGP